jgi:hypothetical protein
MRHEDGDQKRGIHSRSCDPGWIVAGRWSEGSRRRTPASGHLCWYINGMSEAA